MKVGIRRTVLVAGAACLIGSYLAVPVVADAATGVSIGNASYSAYASGDELHTNALTLGTTKLADIEQGFSGATTASGGLTNVFRDPDPTAATNTGQVIQPAQAAGVRAYGMGSGFELGLAQGQTLPADLNQLTAAGKAEAIAPPNSGTVTKTFTIPANPLLGGGFVTGRADALYDPQVCPLGQPISYGLGDATNVSVLPAVPGAVVGTSGSGTSTAHSDSFTYLQSNNDGTYGLASRAEEIVAPITVKLGPLTAAITISGNQAGTAPANPVTLQAVSTGEGTSSVKLTNDNFLTVTLNGTALIPPTALAGLTGPRTIPLLGLGTITVNELTQASNGNSASAAFTLFGLNLALPGLPLLNLEAGHMVVGANLAGAITCPLPIAKTSTPPVVTAGNDFIYTIFVPDPAKLPLLACNLTNISVVDTISDAQGSPTFNVVSASNGGKIVQTSKNSATVSFSGLSYTIAPVGQPPNPPLALRILVAVPKDSPQGTFQDIANASSDIGGCNGGVTGITGLGGTNHIAGTVKLTAPKVNRAPTTPLAARSGSGGNSLPSLPRTGGTGGLWQPGLGVAILALGGGGLALARRSRRRRA